MVLCATPVAKSISMWMADHNVRMCTAMTSPTSARIAAMARGARESEDGLDTPASRARIYRAVAHGGHQADDHPETDHGESQPGRDRRPMRLAWQREPRSRLRGARKRTGRSGTRTPSTPARFAPRPGTCLGRKVNPRIFDPARLHCQPFGPILHVVRRKHNPIKP